MDPDMPTKQTYPQGENVKKVLLRDFMRDGAINNNYETSYPVTYADPEP